MPPFYGDCSNTFRWITSDALKAAIEMKSSSMPTVPAPLDPAFQPAVLFNRHYVETAKQSAGAATLVIGLEREGGALSRFDTVVKADARDDTLRYVERIVKFLLWAHGGWKLYIGGSSAIGEYIRQCYSASGPRAFDLELMGRVYERPFEVTLTDARSVPPPKESSAARGGHLDGCRIGFDLGASDYKVAAVNEGKMVYSEEFPWDPKSQPDPEYHYQHLSSGLKKAAAHLPRVDAIGGSSAGVIVDDKIMVASLFRAVPLEQFHRARNIFLRIR